eukprot:10872038-Alexandrium_andersonii.AAC.1
MLGQVTYPDAETFARATEEDFRAAVQDHGYFERPGDSGTTKVPIGLVDKARLLQFRPEVIAAFKKSKGHRADAPAIATKKARLSTIVDGAAEAE